VGRALGALSEIEVREARSSDAAPVAAIYNEAVRDRIATFQTREHDAADIERLIPSKEVFLVAERDGEVLGAAWVSDYDPVNDYYAGVGEVTVYVSGSARRQGIGAALLAAAGHDAAASGRHKLTGKIFSSNRPSLHLFERAGYDVVGVHRRHERLDGDWKDVVVVERLLDED
jgi:L-amino acid N-acyltransferase YncA